MDKKIKFVSLCSGRILPPTLASLPLAPLDRPFEERAERRARQRSAPHNHFSRHDGRETNCGDRGSAEEETPAGRAYDPEMGEVSLIHNRRIT